MLRGFDATQADLALQRAFRITEKTALLLRGEFFNVLNHPNFGSPTNSLTSPLFGRSTETLANFLGAGGANGGFNPLYQIGGPRPVQLAVKLQFWSRSPAHSWSRLFDWPCLNYPMRELSTPGVAPMAPISLDFRPHAMMKPHKRTLLSGSIWSNASCDAGFLAPNRALSE